jgi:hypothetical protein
MASLPPLVKVVRGAYRTLARLIQRIPDAAEAEQAWMDMKIKFRTPLAANETARDRLRVAADRISYLRIVTPKDRPWNQSGKWVYKDGVRIKDGKATSRQPNGKVVSNWMGYNMDPCSVKRHKWGLRRMGFVNNLHAKGAF